jgi:hypothetical protein
MGGRRDPASQLAVETDVDTGKLLQENQPLRWWSSRMSKGPLMFRPRHPVQCILVWLAAAMLPVQPASVLAGCCGQAGRPGAKTPHCSCCGDSDAPSLPSKCQRGQSCSCCCPPQKDPPTSTPTLPTTRHRSESGFTHAITAACTDAARSAISAPLPGSFPESSILSPAQHCVSLCKLQL